ncbi:hypothetical protein LguiB_023496 [Lonicera macranthoides]
MATANPFDLLGDDDNDDPSQLIAAQQQKIVPKKVLAPAQAAPAPQAKPAKLPSKPAPPALAVREAKNEGGRGGGRSGGRGYGRGRGAGGYNRDSANNDNSFSNSGYSGGQGAIEESNTERSYDKGGGYGGPRGGFRGGRRGGSSNGEVGDGDRPRRVFERRSGTGRGGDFKREGAGRGNWGTQADELAQVTEEVVNEGEKNLGAEKPSGEEDATEGNKENPAKEPEEKEPEGMTLEEYQKVLEEKRKALLALKTEERKVGVDKELASMQQLSSKKSNDEIFVKLGSDKDKRKEIAEKEERAKKSFFGAGDPAYLYHINRFTTYASLSINEFLKPAEGERYFTHGGRSGRGRGRGSRGGGGGGGGDGGGFNSTSAISSAKAPSIEDHGQFPTLGGK